MLDAPERRVWSENGVRYGQQEDLYSMPEVVADYIEDYARASSGDQTQS